MCVRYADGLNTRDFGCKHLALFLRAKWPQHVRLTDQGEVALSNDAPDACVNDLLCAYCGEEQPVAVMLRFRDRARMLARGTTVALADFEQRGDGIFSREAVVEREVDVGDIIMGLLAARHHMCTHGPSASSDAPNPPPSSTPTCPTPE